MASRQKVVRYPGELGKPIEVSVSMGETVSQISERRFQLLLEHYKLPNLNRPGFRGGSEF